MKANLIEITVSGRTGSGKSEVLNVIQDALDKFYGKAICKGFVFDKDVLEAIDAAKTTGQTAKKNTVFVLYEQNVTDEIKVHD